MISILFLSVIISPIVCSENMKYYLRTHDNRTHYFLGEEIRFIIDLPLKELKKDSVHFYHNAKMISEVCLVFKKEHYAMKCNEMFNFKRFEFRIKTARWEDRGKWYFAHKVQHSNTINLQIMVVSKQNTLRVNRADTSLFIITNSKNGIKTASKMLLGRGSRSNPFDLRSPGTSIHVSCESECAHPYTRHNWLAINIDHLESKSASKPDKISSSGPFKFQPTSILNKSCDLPGYKGMQQTHSLIQVNCSMALSGSGMSSAGGKRTQDKDDDDDRDADADENEQDEEREDAVDGGRPARYSDSKLAKNTRRKLSGLVRIECRMDGLQYRMLRRFSKTRLRESRRRRHPRMSHSSRAQQVNQDFVKSVYVLCKGGNQKPQMTKAEMASIGISVGIVALLAAFVVVFLYRRAGRNAALHTAAHKMTFFYPSGVPAGAAGGGGAGGVAFHHHASLPYPQQQQQQQLLIAQQQQQSSAQSPLQTATLYAKPMTMLQYQQQQQSLSNNLDSLTGVGGATVVGGGLYVAQSGSISNGIPGGGIGGGGGNTNAFFGGNAADSLNEGMGMSLQDMAWMNGSTTQKV